MLSLKDGILLKKENLASGVYGWIKSTEVLSKELSVGRTPVRKAAQHLARERWLRINSRRTIQVRSVPAEDLREIPWCDASLRETPRTSS